VQTFSSRSEISRDFMFTTLTVFTILLFIGVPVVGAQPGTQGPQGTQGTQGKADIFYNEACIACAIYLERLTNTLRDEGIEDIKIKDYINDKRYRIEVNEYNKRNGIPPDLQGHITTIINDRVILEGHVPEAIIKSLLSEENDRYFEKIVVYQDEMSDTAPTYKIWAFRGDAMEYPLDTPVSEYLVWFDSNKDELKGPTAIEEYYRKGYLLPLVVVSGLIDGINPCAFAVILFFIAFLYTINKTRAGVFKMGIAYIGAIYMAYFLIGIGLLKAFTLMGSLGTPHIMARLGSYLMISLGLINIINYIKPGGIPIHLATPLRLKRMLFGKHKDRLSVRLAIPRFSRKYLLDWAYKATFPSAVVLGFLVGLCTFPCSGGIYVAILGLLVSKTTYFEGLGYLMLYNLMFVMPLIVLLLISSNRKLTERLDKWRESKAKEMKLALGIILILLGVIILKWFI